MYYIGRANIKKGLFNCFKGLAKIIQPLKKVKEFFKPKSDLAITFSNSPSLEWQPCHSPVMVFC